MSKRRPFGKALKTAPPKPPARVEKVISGVRRAGRRRTLLKGKLAFGVELFSVDCIIKDLSVKGARVAIETGTLVPTIVHLVDLRHRLAFEAEVAWRHADGHLGLTFRRYYDLEKARTLKLKALRLVCVESALRSASVARDETLSTTPS
jgi:hypothetical protein